MEAELLLCGSTGDDQGDEHVAFHKEVVSSMRYQPWRVGRKLRILRKAKLYVRQHEGALQQRLAESRTAKDVFARGRLLIYKVNCLSDSHCSLLYVGNFFFCFFSDFF